MFIQSVMNKGKNWGQEWVEMIVKSGAWNCWCALLTAFIPEFSEGSGGVQGGEGSEEYACTGIMPSCGHREYGVERRQPTPYPDRGMRNPQELF